MNCYSLDQLLSYFWDSSLLSEFCLAVLSKTEVLNTPEWRAYLYYFAVTVGLELIVYGFFLWIRGQNFKAIVALVIFYNLFSHPAAVYGLAPLAELLTWTESIYALAFITFSIVVEGLLLWRSSAYSAAASILIALVANLWSWHIALVIHS